MADLFRFVWTTSLYASVVGLVVIFVKALMKDRLNAQWHYLIWIVLILKLAVPFGPESGISMFNVIPVQPQEVVDTRPPVPGMDVPSPIYTEPVERPAYNGSGSVQPQAKRDAKLEVWMLGAVLLLFWLTATHFMLHYKVEKNKLAIDERLSRIFAACKKKMGVKTPVSLVMQDCIAAPSIFGVMRPKLLLSSVATALSDKELEYILLHELAHIRRKDIWVNYLLLAFQVVHWFNPLLWYCFKHIREDMEVATDEFVLSKLNSKEHKEYGLTLIALLDRFSTPRLTPRLLGMVDDPKNMARRIQMIKLVGYFRGKRTRALVAGMASLLVLSGLLLTNGLTKAPSPPPRYFVSQLLYEHRTPYVGNSTKVSHLVNSLPFIEPGQVRHGISLKTSSRPYVLTVNYTLPYGDPTAQEVAQKLRNNAAILFVLIDNVDEVTFHVKGKPEEQTYSYTREELEALYGTDLRVYAESLEVFERFIVELTFTIWVAPSRYTPSMSSMPGIRITPEYRDSWDEVRFSTDYGVLSTWDVSNGIVSDGVKRLTFDRITSVYWSPGEDAETDTPYTVTVSFLEAGRTVAEKQITIHAVSEHGVTYYTTSLSQGVAQEPTLPNNIDDAVRAAIRATGSRYHQGEVLTTAQVIIAKHEVHSYPGGVTIFAVTSIGWFGFRNGIFTKISGTGTLPVVMQFERDIFGYRLVGYEEPRDGADYLPSIKKMFPGDMWENVLNLDYKELARQEEAQAAEYLKSIGREAQVTSDYVEVQLPNIDVQASNRLFSEMTKYDAELAAFPYWLGTLETIENGTRYIYETAQSKTADGHDLVTFTKTTESGDVITRYRYKIAGSLPQLME